mgnify:CR=1 FL=1
MGQRRPVRVIKLACAETVDEKVLEVADAKRATQACLLGEGEGDAAAGGDGDGAGGGEGDGGGGGGGDGDGYRASSGCSREGSTSFSTMPGGAGGPESSTTVSGGIGKDVSGSTY